MRRVYQAILEHHLDRYDQMIFLTGPRQVGKTTLVRSLLSARTAVYYNWDNLGDRKTILLGYEAITESLHLDVVAVKRPVVIFDEIHKMTDWKNFLKGFYDTFKSQLQIIVTGSARLDVYKKGGDSLMGRYFLYHQYPFDASECLRTSFPEKEITAPQNIDDKLWSNLFEFGGFPEPFVRHDEMFLNQWQNLKHNQLFREDLRDLSKIRDIASCEMLASVLQYQSGQLVNYSKLSKHLRISDYSVRLWIESLHSLYYCFFIYPWSENVPRSLLKEPKCYLWDWSLITERGAKVENFVACHLFKAINMWQDIGLGRYGLHFLRDKDKNEVDFLVTKNEKPWIMVEVKTSPSASLNKALYRFQKYLDVQHVLQVAYDMPYIDKDSFEFDKPMIVPMRTFLSQLS